MSTSKQLAVCALLCALAVPALAASDDDDLAPLTPVKKAPPRAAPKKAPAPPPAKKAQARPAAGDDDLAPLTPVAAKGELTVRVSGQVSGAVLSVDGKELGVLPLGPQAVGVGEHLVTVKRPGYAAFVKKVTIGRAKSVDLEAKLTAVAAVISVSSDVPNAQVFLNGRLVGTAPISDFEVPPGTVELSVLKEGFREDKQKLTLVAGRDYPVVVKFGPPPSLASDRPVDTALVPANNGEPALTGVAQVGPAPIYQRWYFWAGVVVVVAAASVGTVLAVNASRSPGHYQPTQVCNGTCDASLGF